MGWRHYLKTEYSTSHSFSEYLLRATYKPIPFPSLSCGYANLGPFASLRFRVASLLEKLNTLYRI